MAAGAVAGSPTNVGQIGQWGIRVEHHGAADAKKGLGETSSAMRNAENVMRNAENAMRNAERVRR
jgi:hypothetical protein